MGEAEQSILHSLADQDNRLVVISHEEGLKDDVDFARSSSARISRRKCSSFPPTDFHVLL